MVTVGKITEELMQYWIPMVNAEYGLSDRNEASFEFFRKLIPFADLIENDKYYIVGLCSTDMWGDPCLSILSWYIKPECRTLCTIKQLQRDIIELAKMKNVRYICQGSHLDDGILKLLGKLGYKPQTMMKEI